MVPYRKKLPPHHDVLLARLVIQLACLDEDHFLTRTEDLQGCLNKFGNPLPSGWGRTTPSQYKIYRNVRLLSTKVNSMQSVTVTKSTCLSQAVSFNIEA